jgi:hypothetical protein
VLVHGLCELGPGLRCQQGGVVVLGVDGGGVVDDQRDTTRETLICGAPFWASVAHPWCATHIKPLIFITSGARLHAPRLRALSVAHLYVVRHA